MSFFIGDYIETLDKTVYLHNRQYLALDSPLRKDTQHFPAKSVELGPQPSRKNFIDVMYNSVACDRAPNSTQAKNVAKGSGCKACYSMMLLPEQDQTLQSFPDVMHCLKNVVVAFVDLMTGREDSAKVRNTEESLGRFPGCASNNPSIQGKNSVLDFKELKKFL